MNYISCFYQRHHAVLLRIWKEARIPLIGAVLWLLISILQGRRLFESISSASAAFFFLLFAQGQVLRIAKNVRDDTNANLWSESFSALSQAVDELKPASLTDFMAHVEEDRDVLRKYRVDQLRQQYATSFTSEAKTLVESGHHFAAILVASAAVNSLLRELPHYAPINTSLTPRKMIADLLKKCRISDEDRLKIAHAVSRYRNALNHSIDSGSVDRETAVCLIEISNLIIDWFIYAATESIDEMFRPNMKTVK
jgi:hypothetical protein